MADITGGDVVIGFKVGSVFETAVACGASDRLEVLNITHGENAEELSTNPIGSGTPMLNDAQRGGTDPRIEFTKRLHYDDAANAALALLYGTDTVVNMGSGAYCHSLTLNETRFSKFGTLAIQPTTTEVMEYPSCSPAKATITMPQPPGYVDLAMTLLGNKLELASAVNTSATMSNLTLANSNRMVADQADYLWINAIGGSTLSSSDKLNFTNLVFDHEYQIAANREYKGSAGNGQFLVAGDPPLSYTLTFTLKNLADLTYFTAMQAGTEYKAHFRVRGPLIGGSQYYQMEVYIPRMKIITDISRPLNSSAYNPTTLTFMCLVADSLPSGMTRLTPYLNLYNTKSAAYV